MSNVSQNVATVNFKGDTLITLEKDGEHYAAIRPIVENMGLDWGNQSVKLKNPKFGCCDIATPTKGGKNPLDKVGFLFYSIWQGVSKPPILHSVIATPSDFLLPITFCYGQDGAYRENAQPTVYGVLNILSTLFQTRVKSQYTGVLANV